MKDCGTVRLMTPDQLKELASAIIQQIPTNVAFEEAQRVIRNKRVIKTALASIFKVNMFVAEQLAVWERIYGKDFSDLHIPEMREGFEQLVVIPQGMTPNRLFAKVKERVPAWRYFDDLDTVVSDRTAQNGDYAVWMRKRIEADEELKKQSANDLKRDGIPGITLEERLAYEIFSVTTTCKHLDVENITLCSGSRYAFGCVPDVRWYGGKLRVDFFDPSDAYADLRSRAVVS